MAGLLEALVQMLGSLKSHSVNSRPGGGECKSLKNVVINIQHKIRMKKMIKLSKYRTSEGVSGVNFGSHK